VRTSGLRNYAAVDRAVGGDLEAAPPKVAKAPRTLGDPAPELLGDLDGLGGSTMKIRRRAFAPPPCRD
jgi:hypothetical protein